MLKQNRVLTGAAIFLAIALAAGGYWWQGGGWGDPSARLMRAVSGVSVESAPAGKLRLHYPLDETLFPRDIVAPTFRWEDASLEADCWVVVFDFQDGEGPLRFVSEEKTWTASEEAWATIKQRSLEKPVAVSILGVRCSEPGTPLSGARVSISTSQDEVGAPIFYREVPLPFVDTVKNPSRIRWRFGSVAKREAPRLLLDGIPTCANCHSFSRDARTFAMEVDSANDKGSYLIASVEPEIRITDEKIMTWSDYEREDRKITFGLLAQVAPDGRNVLCMVKDRSVFLPRPGIEFSQLFFPIRGILVNYRVESKTFRALPGASDPAYVQANPTWSPDGREILFARQEAYYLKNLSESSNKTLLTPEECEEFITGNKLFTYDLYRLPYNDGAGGEPTPVEGASNNGMSNYFPKYSPDGKWIVFCRSKSFMLLQPDSELYIIPSCGGEARRLRCNTSRMNSWHSWSPNGKWLVFSSKANGPYTQLHLTHIDDSGNSTPPVVLSHFDQPERAANIPEFVNASHEAIQKIVQEYIDDLSFTRAADTSLDFRDMDEAIPLYRKALELNPKNDHALNNLGYILLEQKKLSEAIPCLEKGLSLAPENALLHYNYGRALGMSGQTSESIAQYREAIRLDPKLVGAYRDLGIVLHERNQLDESEWCFQKVIELEPRNGDAYYNLGYFQMEQGKWGQAAENFRQAAQINPRNVDAWASLAQMAANQGQYDDAKRHYTQALKIQPNHTKILFELGSLLFLQGDVAEAETWLVKASRLAPQDAVIHYRLALVLYRQGKTEPGNKELVAASELNAKYGNAPEPLLMHSIHCAEKGDFPQAQALAEEALGKAHQAAKGEIAQEIETYLAAYRQGRLPGSNNSATGG